MRLNQNQIQADANALLLMPFPACICNGAGELLDQNEAFGALSPAWTSLFNAVKSAIGKKSHIQLSNPYFQGQVGIQDLASEKHLLVFVASEIPEPSTKSRLNQISQAVATLDGEGRLIEYNNAFEKLALSFGFQELKPGLDLLKYFPSNDSGSGMRKFYFPRGENMLEVQIHFIPLSPEKTLMLAIEQMDTDSSSNSKYRLLSENDLVACVVLDADLRIKWCNNSFEKLTGWRFRELENQALFEHVLSSNPLDKERVRAEKSIQSHQHSNMQLKLNKKNGNKIWVKANFSSITGADETLYSVVLRDITQEIEIQEKLGYQLQQNEGILKAIPDLIYRVTGDGYYLTCHASNEKDLLVPLKDIPGMRFFDMPEAEELKNRVWNKIQRALKTGKVQEIEYQRRNQRGETHHYEARISKSGPNEVVYFVRNISERITGQHRLEQSEKKWKSIIQNGFDGIILLDAKGMVIDHTPNVTKHFNLAKDTLIGRNMLRYIPLSERSAFLDIFKSLTLKSKKKIRRDFSFRVRKGGILTVEASAVNMLETPEVKAIVINYREITERKNSEAKLLESFTNLNAIINNTHDQICLFDLDFHVIIQNKPYKQAIQTAFDMKDTDGISLHDLPDSEAKTFWVNALNQIVSNKKRLSFERVNKFGRIFRVSLTPIKGANKEITSISYFATDITDVVNYERSLSRSRETISTILSTTSAGIFILDGLRIIYSNDQCEHILGRSKRELFSHDITEFVHPDEKEGIMQRAHKRKKGFQKPLHYEIRIITQAGVERWLDVQSSAIHYNDKEHTIATVLDITDQKIQEQKLIEAKELAEELTRLKSNFLANMSHEIRTPLNGLLGLSELITMTDDLNEIREMAQLQRISGNRLLDTLTSILNLSRLEAENNSVHLVKIHMHEFLHEIVKVHSAPYQLKKIKLELIPPDQGIYCLADETMLYQVFNNLLGNALKFTDAGGVHIQCNVQLNKANLPQLQIQVKDSGIGIASDFLPHIFESFRQESQGIGRKYEGSGLGLAIAKKYLNLLNGDLSVKSTKGEGSVFTITLPIKENK
ncbi:MAG: PAS domain S-box protein [Bacteroidetes bacterium]|nr:MAG: PAS domain S-box protein [Bacteroidota bacterium]